MNGAQYTFAAYAAGLGLLLGYGLLLWAQLRTLRRRERNRVNGGGRS